MAQKQKSSKAGRKAKSPQNIKYKNERRREQNKLIRLQRHIKAHGVTKEVKERIRILQIALGHSPSDYKIDRPIGRSDASAAFHRRSDAGLRRSRMKTQGVLPKGEYQVA